MTIGILGALEDEIKLITGNMVVSSQEKHLRRTFYRGTLEKHEVVVARSGIGKVRAAACSQFLIEHFGVNQIIFAGTAGALHPDLGIGDIVVSARALEWDFQSETVRHRWYEADYTLLNSAVTAAERLGHRVQTGTVLTGDRPVLKAAHKHNLWQTYNGDCVDMEGGAAAHVCWLNETPFVLIRAISDLADEAALQDIWNHFERVALLPAQVVIEMLKAPL